jgi:hypothetical protein
MTAQTEPHYFDRRTMRFFGQTLKDFKVQRCEDGRYQISSPMRNQRGDQVGTSVRFFNLDTLKLEIA